MRRSERFLLPIETLGDNGKSQGMAPMRMDQLYHADRDGAFALASYIACSDEYYRYWTEHEMSWNTYHHFCRATSLRACASKVGKQGIVHVLKLSEVIRSEAEKVLREWGFSPVLLNRKAPPSECWGFGHCQCTDDHL